MSRSLMKILLRYFILLNMLYIMNTININGRPERVKSSTVQFANKTRHQMNFKYFTKKQESVTNNGTKYNSYSKLHYDKIEKSDKATKHKYNHISFSNKSTNETINKCSNSIDIFKDKKIIKLLLIIYILVAVPLWCTKGWCCCFLCCKIFKPEKTIEEAKKFLELNPPGVLFHKETLIHYEPSTKEKYCYEKFEHLIRTI